MVKFEFLKLGYTTFTGINVHNIKQTENQNKTKPGHAKNKQTNKKQNKKQKQWSNDFHIKFRTPKLQVK